MTTIEHDRDTLSEAQRQLATSSATTTVGIAGPGSGKTHTLVCRYRLWHHLRTWIVTFTNNAATELRKRIEDIGLPAPDFCGTLHALALRELRNHGRPGITLLDETEAEELMQEAIHETMSKGSPTALRKALTAPTRTQSERVLVMRYRAKLREADAEDFDTLLLAFEELLQDHEIRIAHLMVDEYQDSGEIDHRIYKAIHAAMRFIVGDTDQAIYGFRGGRMENLLETAEAAGSFVGFLEDNYRSTPEICQAAQRLIRNNRNRIEKTTTGLRNEPSTVRALRFANEYEEATSIASYAFANPATAVLCRYNTDRTRILQAFGAVGIKIAKDTPTLPRDFKLAMTCLKMTANPTHPHAVLAWIRATDGPDAAQARKVLAAQTGRPPLGPEAPDDPIAWCERFGLSFETRSLLKQAMRACGGEHRTMRDNATEMQLWLRAYATEPPPAPADAAVCLTVHGSKGMEFDNVIVQGVDAAAYGRNPEEDRRLLYVAMTRARRNLTLTTAAERENQWKRCREQHQPSRFLTEISGPA